MNYPAVKFGIMADVHLDFMYNAGPRLEQFIEHEPGAGRVRIQLGDYAT